MSDLESDPKLVRWLKVAEVAESLVVSPATVIQWIHTGDLKAVQIGRTLRIHPDVYREFLDDAGFSSRVPVD